MYEVKIKIEDRINTFTIEELKQLKELLEQFKKTDEITMRYIEGGKRK